MHAHIHGSNLHAERQASALRYRLRAFARLVLLFAGLLSLSSAVFGQTPPGAPAAPAFTQAQLDQMVAPIALYPDTLLGQILTAATYPLEIVQADRWLQVPANSQLQGAALDAALQQLPWDPSIKSLLPFPQILGMLDHDLEWTESVGDAFLAQQSDVMDAVQRLRVRAQAAGTLRSTPQQTVTNADQAIEIAPSQPNTVYVPVYDPDMAFGDWPYPDYPPYEFVFPGYPFGVFIGFPIFAPWWGWGAWDWYHHRYNIVGGVPGWRPAHVGPWQHDPAHRGGVPYRDEATRARFEGGQYGRAPGSGYRGYAAAPTAGERPEANRRAPAMPQTRMSAPSAPRYEVPRTTPNSYARPSAPAFESFGHGPQVRTQEQRGTSSRMSAPSGGARRPR